MTRRTASARLAALLVLVLTAAPAAASPVPPAARVAAAPVGPLFGGYWDSFLDHWTGVLKKQNGVIMLALGVGAVSLFIITRGKWIK
jgi:hypothetical protein